MKRCFLAMMVLMGCVATAAAYDYPYLTFSTQGGVTRSVAAEELVITFADGKMIAHSAQGDLELELQALDKMCFTTEQSGVSSAVAAGGVVRVFSMQGVEMGTYASQAEAVSRLPQGIYIVKHDGSTLKLAVK